MKFIGFISTLTVLLGLLGFYLVRRLLSAFPFLQRHEAWVWVGLIIFLGLQFTTPFFRNLDERAWYVVARHWVGYTLLGLFISTVVYCVIGDVVLGIWARFPSVPENLHRSVMIVVLAVAGSTAVVGALQAMTGPRLKTVMVPIKNLAPELEGFTIAQVADLHIGPTIGRHYAEKVVRLVNGVNADMVALTGDLLDGTPQGIAEDIAPLANLRARHGVYFVTGNHEYYWEALPWIAVFRKMGWSVLLNEHRVITVGGANVVVGGVTDYSAGSFFRDQISDPVKAAQGAPVDALKILLAHQPASYGKAVEAGFDLQLSGHTHGGQFVPWAFFVWLTQKYSFGLNRYDDKMWIYTTNGTAFWGPPNRFLIPSEISVIKLVRAR